ncbi:S27A2 synthetase, partial [Corvus moneduloides]|nr:S27A2 synthetase [Corvus moneduloides]
ELREAVEEVLPDLERDGVRVFYLSSASPTPGVEALLPTIEAAPDEPLPARHRASVTANSKAMYIYTSGTTGLPKAAVITELKMMMVASLGWMCGLRPDDVVYTTLPLYHSAGLLVGVGGCLEVGTYPSPHTDRAQARAGRDGWGGMEGWMDGWKDSWVEGQLWPLSCVTPQRADDREHGVRMALGNGMRAEVWKEFLRRFGPVAVWEFYGATEGNAGFINYTG